MQSLPSCPGIFRAAFLIALIAAAGCAGTIDGGPRRGDSNDAVEFAFLQINDVYEIGPTAGGRSGGLARVKTLLDRTRSNMPHTYLVLAGDFVSPSAMGTANINGKRLAGRQMIDVLNKVGLDIAIFGNHEFDVKPEVLAERLSEASFQWPAGNVVGADGKPYDGRPRSIVLEVPSAPPIKVGIVAITMKISTEWAKTIEASTSVRQQLDELKGATDLIVAVTHQSIDDDRALAKAYPEFALIMGGHEHERLLEHVGSSRTPIAKADSNARSVARHIVRYERSTRRATVATEFVPLGEEIPLEVRSAAEVDRWTALAAQAFAASGIHIDETVTSLPLALNGLSEHVRNKQAEIGAWLTGAALDRCPKATASLINSGTIRIDDFVGPGEISEYDILRIAPFDDRVICATALGRELKEFLVKRQQLKGSGDYMQLAGISEQDGRWIYPDGRPIGDEDAVVIASLKFLLDDRLPLPVKPGSVVEAGDLRLALIERLRRSKP